MDKSLSPNSTETLNPIEVPIVSSKAKDETEAEETEVLSEKLNNLIIKLSELTNMDPLEYFSRFQGIPEMISKHLSRKDLISASEVSPSYYNFIASSKVLMKKIQVVFDRDFKINGKDLVRIPKVGFFDHNFLASSIDLMETKIGFNDKSATQLEDFNLLKNSSRLYQNIEIRRWFVNVEDGNGNQREVGDYITDSELDFFCSKAHEWKNVSLDNVYFRKKLDLWRLLSAIEPSVEYISVREFGILSFEDPSSEIESVKALKFPKFKKLRVHFKANTFSETLVRFLLNSVSIEELDLIDNTGEVDKDILLKMLENFGKLKNLAIISRITDQIFRDESWKKFQFKLKSLTIVFANTRTRDHVTNFLNFLKSQSDHLEELKITLTCKDRETIFDMIMTMPKLKCLVLWYTKAFSENEIPNKISTSITELTLYKCDSAVSVKYLLDAMPKVTKLSLKSIDDEDFKMLKSMKRKFEILRVCELKGVDIKGLEEIMIENYTSLIIVELYQLLYVRII